MADNDVTRIAGNIGAMNALYALTNINKQLSIHQTRLATGKRINSAADDPAGLAISTKMLARSEGLKVALSNIGDAKNLLAVAESGLGRLSDILSSMRTITENAANDTNGNDERNIVKEQLASYAQQINDIVAQTKWSDKLLIDGSYNAGTGSLTFQTGADAGETTQLTGLANMHAAAMKLLTEATSAATQTIASTTAGTGLTAATAAITGSEISTGAYSVVTTFTGSAGGYSISLVNASGVSVASATGTYTAGSTKTIDFGVGVSVTMASSGILTSAHTSALSTSAIGTNLAAATSALVGSNTEAASGAYHTTFSILSSGAYTANLVNASSVVVATATGTYSAGTAKSVNFGNGISVTLASNGIITTGSVSSLTMTLGSNATTAATAAVTGTNTEIASGTYTISGTKGSGTITANLMSGATVMGTFTGAYSGATVMDFGNGIKVTTAADVADGTLNVSGNIVYTKSVANSYTMADSNSFNYTSSAPDAYALGNGTVNYTKTVAYAAGTVNIGEDSTGSSLSVDFQNYMKTIDDAMVLVNQQLSKIGSLTGSLTFKEDQISSSQINVEASYNRIMNANMAEEQVNASKLMILQQTSTAMLAQANAAPQFLLSLFK